MISLRHITLIQLRNLNTHSLELENFIGLHNQSIYFAIWKTSSTVFSRKTASKNLFNFENISCKWRLTFNIIFLYTPYKFKFIESGYYNPSLNNLVIDRVFAYFVIKHRPKRSSTSFGEFFLKENSCRCDENYFSSIFFEQYCKKWVSFLFQWTLSLSAVSKCNYGCRCCELFLLKGVKNPLRKMLGEKILKEKIFSESSIHSRSKHAFFQFIELSLNI